MPKRLQNQQLPDGETSLQETIASWYKSFRNIAVVGLLSVLVYLAIRILISSTAADKAKYKESLRDWFVALCLVFVIHIVMSGILLLTDTINSLFSASVDDGIIVQATHSDEGDYANQKFKFRTNLIGLARFKAQADQWQDATAYTIIYLALVIYTCMFTFMYFKRFLWMAFFTMIAPLVALTYPIDKAGDGHAQAFNLWFKEYTMNAIIQPVHLILYSVFVTSAIDLAVDNPIYAVVAIAFLVSAEKFIKKMFGLDQATTEGDFGSFAGGALTMSALNALKGMGAGKGGKQKTATDKGENPNDDKVVFAKNDDADKLNSFNRDDGNSMFPEENQGEEMDPDRLAMEQDRDVWQDMANDPNETEQNRADAQEEVDRINDEMRDRGYLDDEEGAPENGLGAGDSFDNGEGEVEQWDSQIFPRLTAFRNKAKEKAPGLGRFALRGAKTLGKGAGKGALIAGRGLMRAAGMMGGATVGLAAGLTTGDMSKTFQFAATGAAAGNIIGKNLNNMTGRAARGIMNAPRNIKQTGRNLKYAWDYDMNGAGVARENRMISQNKEARKQLLKDEDQKQKAQEWMGKNNYTGDIKDVLNARADLYEAGVREDLIDDAMKTEFTNTGSLSGANHQGYVDAAGFISKHNYTKDSIEDEEKMARMEERVQSRVDNPDAQLAVMRMTSKMLGADKMYEQRRKEGKTRIGNPRSTGQGGQQGRQPNNNE